MFLIVTITAQTTAGKTSEDGFIFNDCYVLRTLPLIKNKSVVKIYSKRSAKIILIEMMNYNISYRHTRKIVNGESDLVWRFVLSCNQQTST